MPKLGILKGMMLLLYSFFIIYFFCWDTEELFKGTPKNDNFEKFCMLLLLFIPCWKTMQSLFYYYFLVIIEK